MLLVDDPTMFEEPAPAPPIDLVALRNKRFNDLYKEQKDLLDKQFGRLGAHYQILVKQAASAYAAVRCCDEGLDPDMSTAAYNQRSESLRKVIGQIQQYTEKNKGEMLQQARQDGAATVLEIARQTLSPADVATLGAAVREALAG